MRTGARACVLTGGLLLAAVPSTPPAVAEAATCHGQEATIVGMPGAELVGTEGPDVIVTAGASEIDAGAGDDLVCATNTPSQGAAESMHVYAGPGDDTIDTTGNVGVAAQTLLGLGDDTFLGGRAKDLVGASRSHLNGMPPAAEGHDVVSTGGGRDFVSTGGLTVPDTDDIDLGDGDDELSFDGLVDPGRVLLGGAGRDTVGYERLMPVGDWLLDNAAGTASRDGKVLQRWAGFEKFDLYPRKTGTIAFVGSPADESVFSGAGLVSVNMAAGDDSVHLQFRERPRDHDGRILGGAGDDRLFVEPYHEPSAVTLDLRRGRLSFSSRPDARPFARVSQFERHDVTGGPIRIVGSSGPDTIRFRACHGVVSGGRGSDNIGYALFGYEGRQVPGQCPGVRVFGGRGADRLKGGDYDDFLSGGPGQDRALGLRGSDHCVAEVRISCEA